uniref:DUF5641 domain-containing protein n=1 Tax=Nippostrongylus brasiliensis TaxID=27835 RepID=A0A0N4XCB3_NIPBR
MESDFGDTTLIRPVDFIQNHLTITLGIYPSDDSQDPNFLSHEEETRKQAESVLISAISVVDKFWQTWTKVVYLTSHREFHKKFLKQGRVTKQAPKLEQIVLIQDPLLPRNKWMFGKITGLTHSADGEVRQVEVKLPNKKIVKRPINLLVPLELT